MPSLLIVDKSGIIKESNVKTFTDLYKKAGFKTSEGFEKVHDWTIDKTTVLLYGKTTGRAGQENKYDFPPPVDSILFFGSCILAVEEGNLTKPQWEKIYEKLFGGFEDLESEDSDEEEEEEDDIDDYLPKTKEGYAKDGFIVEEDEDEDEDEEEEEDEDQDEEEEPIVVKKKPVKKPQVKKNKPTLFEKIETLADSKDDLFLDCTSELEEELYE